MKGNFYKEKDYRWASIEHAYFLLPYFLFLNSTLNGSIYMKQELLILALSLETLRANSNGVWWLLWPFPFPWKGYGSRKLLLHCFQHKLFSNFLCLLQICAKEEHITYWSFCLKSRLVDFLVWVYYIYISIYEALPTDISLYPKQ